MAKEDELTAGANIEVSTFTDSRGTYAHPGSSSESEEKVDAQKPKKKTWVSDWVFDYPK